ncbi:hypothetical protein H4Q26_008930 [Puccinia striiformis f. sp. tritici PST-130]|uniref:Uncharacterized protein n=2 Tax=Puccinia striiformis f. sp. tritici TaxID=168172 RepID=A0A0L0V561_9BASI|nr:hypothetical protein H4Q26_008930 [Puccinia striiformis f. sp. tritici PST-130]KNE94124.1 hypothetical protein PSTG_12554 [Puccinia striiformis f. sp. tritici PST-78]
MKRIQSNNSNGRDIRVKKSTQRWDSLPDTNEAFVEYSPGGGAHWINSAPNDYLFPPPPAGGGHWMKSASNGFPLPPSPASAGQDLGLNPYDQPTAPTLREKVRQLLKVDLQQLIPSSALSSRQALVQLL